MRFHISTQFFVLPGQNSDECFISGKKLNSLTAGDESFIVWHPFSEIPCPSVGKAFLTGNWVGRTLVLIVGGVGVAENPGTNYPQTGFEVEETAVVGLVNFEEYVALPKLPTPEYFDSQNEFLFLYLCLSHKGNIYHGRTPPTF